MDTCFGSDLGLCLMVLRASVVVEAVNLGCEGVSLEECKGFGCVSIQKDWKCRILKIVWLCFH